jgi:Arc/MetJ family transcription regulator
MSCQVILVSPRRQNDAKRANSEEFGLARTSVNLDFALVDEAKGVLGTKETTETIHKALKEVVRSERLRRLSRRRFDFSNEDLDALRISRSENAAGVSVRPRATA